MSTIAKIGQLFNGASVNRRIFRAAASVTAAGILVKLVATLKEVSVAGVYGRSDAMDAFLTAALIPGLLINLISESMNQALVPTLIRVREREGHESAQRLLSNATLWMCVLLIADSARITAVNAELATSKLSLDQATASHDAGVSPRLDVLRAQVDYQNEQQALISTTNQLAKDKLALARAIGLPLDQTLRLTDSEPYAALDNLDPAAAFAQALKNRKDLAAASEQVAAARAGQTAARADQLPTVQFSGDFGDMGQTANHSHGSYSATGSISAPVLQIAKTRGEQDIAGAQVAQASDKLADKVQQVNAEIRDSILDIQSAAKLVEAAKSNVDLANEALSEAQQRFHSGVSDNLPVSQAQSSVEQANDQYIAALYQHNAAKLSLARALGVAQSNLKDYLGGK